MKQIAGFFVAPKATSNMSYDHMLLDNYLW